MWHLHKAPLIERFSVLIASSGGARNPDVPQCTLRFFGSIRFRPPGRWGQFVAVQATLSASLSTFNTLVMSWVGLFIFSLAFFFVLLFLLSRFVGYMKKEQNMEIESLKDTLIDKDNPVGLRGAELEKLKQQQAEAQRHLREVISRIPVVQKDGRFQIDQEEVQRRKAAEQRNGSSGDAGNDVQ